MLWKRRKQKHLPICRRKSSGREWNSSYLEWGFIEWVAKKYCILIKHRLTKGNFVYTITMESDEPPPISEEQK